MAPQSRIAVPQNVEAFPNLATTVTVYWNVKTRTNIQTNNLSPPPPSDIIHAPYIASYGYLECYTRNTLNNQIDTYMFTYFLSKNGMSRLWKKIPTKQELFNGGEDYLFSRYWTS